MAVNPGYSYGVQKRSWAFSFEGVKPAGTQIPTGAVIRKSGRKKKRRRRALEKLAATTGKR